MDAKKALELLMEIVDHELDDSTRPDFSEWFDDMDDEQAIKRLRKARDVVEKEFGV